MKSVVERFNAKFRVTPGCWIWTARLDGGYGRMKIAGFFVKAHRLSYGLHVGHVPQGMCVCHKCDNPSCVNPDHLFLGTQLDNIRDRTEKARSDRNGKAKGAWHYKAKLTVDQVRDICSDPRTQREIAAEYQLGQSQVSRIKNGKHWALRA